MSLDCETEKKSRTRIQKTCRYASAAPLPPFPAADRGKGPRDSSEERGPGEEAAEERPQEEEGARVSPMPGLEVPPEVLADDVEVEPLPVAPGHGEVPRQNEGEEEDQRPRREEPGHDREPPRQERPDENRAPGKDEADEPLEHHGRRAGEVEKVERGPCASAIPRSLVLLERGEGEGGRRDGQGERGVDDVEPSERDDEEGRRHDQARQQGDPLPEAPPCEEDGDEDHPGGRELHRKTRRPFLLAEQGHRRRDGPVVERRFLVVAIPVQVRRHEVAGGEHLAGDLGVTGLVGLEERGVPGLCDEDRDGDRQERPEEDARGGRKRLGAEAAPARQVRAQETPPSVAQDRSGAQIPASVRGESTRKRQAPRQ